jgi:hypothetical protein
MIALLFPHCAALSTLRKVTHKIRFYAVRDLAIL